MSDNIFSAPLKTTYKEDQTEINVDEFRKVVESRRSVRVFNGENIPEDVMNACLDLALLAPNSSNLQPWTFYWVRSKEKKEALVKACLSQPAAQTAAELIVCIARTKTWNDHRNKMIELLEKNPQTPKQALHYYKTLVPFVYSMGFLGIFGLLKKVFFFFNGIKNPSVREPTSCSQMVTWATKSCALACENLMLALRAYSFDSCPMEGFDSKRIKKLLDLPCDANVTMVIGAGKRAENGIYGPRVRFERNNFIKEV
jgi:nitroreductase